MKRNLQVKSAIIAIHKHQGLVLIANGSYELLALSQPAFANVLGMVELQIDLMLRNSSSPQRKPLALTK